MFLSEFDEHFAGFTKTSIAKRGSRNCSNTDANSTPETFWEITSPSNPEQFNKLVNIRLRS